MILLDLDRFKVINESVGHAVGDRLLAAVGQRLVGSLRPSDTVARFGGDEFGIVLDPVTDADEARRIAERIGNELRAPFPMGGREWFISASLGIALGRAGRATPGELLREEFLIPLGLSQYRLAKEIGVPAQRIGQGGNDVLAADGEIREVMGDVIGKRDRH